MTYGLGSWVPLGQGGLHGQALPCTTALPACTPGWGGARMDGPSAEAGGTGHRGLPGPEVARVAGALGRGAHTDGRCASPQR